MSGAFGFISTGGFADPEFLTLIAKLASVQGPDQWGISWKKERLAAFNSLKRNGSLRSRLLHPNLKIPLPFTDQSQVLLMVGHCRLAAPRTTDDLLFIQPTTDNKQTTAIVHKGSVESHEVIRDAYDFPFHPLDSQVFLELIQGCPVFRFSQKCMSALMTTKSSPCFLLAADKRSLFAFRDNEPIWRIDRPEGVYLCSHKATDSARLLEERRPLYLTLPRNLESKDPRKQ